MLMSANFLWPSFNVQGFINIHVASAAAFTLVRLANHHLRWNHTGVFK